MIRDLKVLVAAVLALVAAGALGASGAQAAEFHCSVEPCRYTLKPDGTGKTAHQVFRIVKGETSGVVTCTTLSGEGVAAKTTTEVTFTTLRYELCTVAGSPASLRINGCHYLFSASGQLTLCPAGKEIEFESGGCLVKIAAQGPLSGVSYTNISGKTQTTISIAVNGIKGTVSAGCAGAFGFTGAFTEGEYSTGNTILSGETEAGVAATVWWE
jgi:hypothetical protein